MPLFKADIESAVTRVPPKLLLPPLPVTRSMGSSKVPPEYAEIMVVVTLERGRREATTSEQPEPKAGYIRRVITSLTNSFKGQTVLLLPTVLFTKN